MEIILKNLDSREAPKTILGQIYNVSECFSVDKISLFLMQRDSNKI